MWRLATIGVLVVVLGVGCASGTKSGGRVTHPIAIVMQTTNAPDPNASYFSSLVQKLSGGRIKIVLAGTAYSSLDSRNEPRLVRALRRGKVQMAYIPARAWQEGSPVTAFRALQAPLLVTSYPLLGRITTGPIGRSMLTSLNSIGIVGLGLVPERLRRLLGRSPLDSAQTLRGRRIRPATPTSDPALRALGAVPVAIDNSRNAAPALAHRQIDGVESETISIENNNYMNYAHDLTANIALFAKATTLAIRRSLFERLSPGDRSILLAAARATVAHADPAAAERQDMKELCLQGIRLVTATPSDLASLERLAAPAYATLERDAATRTEIRAIARLKKTLPGAVSTISSCPAKTASGPESKSASPLTGTYVMTASRSDVANGPPDTRNPNNNYGSFRLVLHDGRFRLSDSRPAGELLPGLGAQSYSSGWSAGTFAIQGDQITFTTTSSHGDTPVGGADNEPVVCRWNLYRDQLTFQQLPAAAKARATAHGLDAVGPPLLYVKRWQQRSPAKQAPAASSAQVVGTWVTNISRAEMKSKGVLNYGVTRLVLGRKTFRVSDRRPPGEPLVQGNSHGWTSGTYSIHGSRLTFFIGNGGGDTPLGAHGDTPIVVRWSVYRNTLTLLQGKRNEGGASMWLNPWHEVRGGHTTRRATAFPTGTFETKITPADVHGANGPAWWAHWETLTFTKDGTFTDIWFHPRRSDQPTTHARYYVRGTRMYEVNGSGVTDSFSWSYDRDTLALDPVNTPNLDALGLLIYRAHPWRKIK